MDAIKNYWSDLDNRLEKLIRYGSVKLPTLKEIDLISFGKKISNELGKLTFKELSATHKSFLDYLEVNKYLAPRLYQLAIKNYDFKGEITDQYHIARKVVPGDSKEQFRAHFDSHLFTIVFPIQIPLADKNTDVGQLIYFSNIRNQPKNELSNFSTKLYFKRYASKKGIEKLSNNHKMDLENFEDYQPILFLGNTTLHTNYPVSSNCSEPRITLLAHYFDKSSKYGIGNLLRIFRNR